MIARAEGTGLDRTTILLLALAIVLTLLHHADHVLRVDHSGWPFRQDFNPFTFSLFAYPMILFALFGPRRLFWWRWLFLALGTAFTIYAHTALESPRMQFAMWAENASMDASAPHVHNLPNVESSLLGAIAVAIGMALNVTALVATIAMLRQGLRLRTAARAR